MPKGKLLNGEEQEYRNIERSAFGLSLEKIKF